MQSRWGTLPTGEEVWVRPAGREGMWYVEVVEAVGQVRHWRRAGVWKSAERAWYPAGGNAEVEARVGEWLDRPADR